MTSTLRRKTASESRNTLSFTTGPCPFLSAAALSEKLALSAVPSSTCAFSCSFCDQINAMQGPLTQLPTETGSADVCNALHHTPVTEQHVAFLERLLQMVAVRALMQPQWLCCSCAWTALLSVSTGKGRSDKARLPEQVQVQAAMRFILQQAKVTLPAVATFPELKKQSNTLHRNLGTSADITRVYFYPGMRESYSSRLIYPQSLTLANGVPRLGHCMCLRTMTCMP